MTLHSDRIFARRRARSFNDQLMEEVRRMKKEIETLKETTDNLLRQSRKIPTDQAEGGDSNEPHIVMLKKEEDGFDDATGIYQGRIMMPNITGDGVDDMTTDDAMDCIVYYWYPEDLITGSDPFTERAEQYVMAYLYHHNLEEDKKTYVAMGGAGGGPVEYGKLDDVLPWNDSGHERELKLRTCKKNGDMPDAGWSEYFYVDCTNHMIGPIWAGARSDFKLEHCIPKHAINDVIPIKVDVDGEYIPDFYYMNVYAFITSPSTTMRKGTLMWDTTYKELRRRLGGMQKGDS